MKTLPKFPIAVLALAFIINATSCTKENTPAPSQTSPSLESARLLALNELSCTNGHKPPPPPKCGCVIDSTNYGLVTTFAGNGSPTDVYGTGTAAGFSTPLSLAPDAAGNLYFPQGYKIVKMTPAGTLSIYAGGNTAGSANGYRTSAGFGYIAHIAIGPDGSIYATQPNEKIIRKISPAGLVTTYAGNGVTGNTNGPAATATFSDPQLITVDSHSNVYMTDNYNSIRKITPAGIVSAFTVKNTDGSGFVFSQINGLAVDAADNIYATDGPTVTRLDKITPAGVAISLTGAYGRYNFNALAIDSQGNIYIGNINYISKVTPAGVVSVLAGNIDVNVKGEGDGIGTAATFSDIESLAVDKNDNLYVGDHNLIRKIVIKVTACKTTANRGNPKHDQHDNHDNHNNH
ncbi:MAG TPA: hypothetical protein VK668_00220 [Mucilaginibacter sp.]|nr:hypothetical protein [Mucilaginibacter sp.]